MFKITRPTLLLDKQKCLSNIAAMAEKARQNEVRLRPHFKTHQSAEIGNWFRNFGVTGITVSSVEMVAYFAKNGWDDITVAFPANILEMDEINRLAKQIRLNLVVESLFTASFLKKHLTSAVGIFIKIDTGYGRTGIPANLTDEIEALVGELHGSPKIHFRGFLAHSGHAYYANSRREVETINQATIRQMVHLKEHFNEIENLELSIGDTPCCSVSNNFKGMDEIRPGNFVFYDLMQQQIGACDVSQIAVAMVCPIVAKHFGRRQLVIHGGAVHFSKDFLVSENGERHFGLPVKLTENGWAAIIPGMYLAALSQEHGILQCEKVSALDDFEIGDLVGILPVHSCLTADLMGDFFTLAGEKISSMRSHRD